MCFFNALKFILKSIGIALLSMIVVTVVCIGLLSLDLSFMEAKPLIQSYNEELNLNIPIDGEYIERYSDSAFQDSSSYTVFKMHNVSKQEFISAGFVEREKYKQELIDRLYEDHRESNISYMHMINLNQDYLFLYSEKSSLSYYYFVYDEANNYLFVFYQS